MKISCPSCEAKYSIADEKVQGKVAKIRCKKCGATIVVGGQGGAESQPAVPAAAASQASYSVSVADGDQRTMTLPELVDAYNQGVVTGDTYVWADGMDDWKAISDVPEIVGALGGGGAEPAAASEPPAPEPEPVAAPAARRESGRKGGVDLFGGGADAAPAPMPTPMAAPSGPVGGDMGSLTGARNEQSTLFSLNALQQAAEKGRPSNPGAAPEKKTSEDSGLIDLSALAKAASTEQHSAAPPLMMSAPVLGAPVLGAPALEAAAVTATPPPPAKNNTGIFIGIGIGVLGLAIAGAILLRPAPPPPAAPAAATTDAPAKTAEPAPTASSTAVDPTATAAPDATASQAKAGAAAPKAGGPLPKGTAKPDAKAPDPPPTAAPPPPKPAASPCGCAPGDLMCNMKCSTKKK